MAERESEIIQWVKEALGTEKCSVKLGGTSTKGEGYVADIAFLTVTFDDDRKQLNLVAKMSKTAPDMRERMGEACKREVLFYSEILPIFSQFQDEKNIKEPFNSFPKCYKAFLTENSEVLILENLKSAGYENHIRNEAMTMDQIKMTLKNFAKFHAVSLALNDQRKDIFERIERQYDTNVLRDLSKLLVQLYATVKPKVIKILIEAGRDDLAKKYDKMVDDDVAQTQFDVIDDVPEERVVAHCDSHSSNMMFKYDDGNKERLKEMVLIDFQISSIHSPMIDIGMFLYCTLTKTKFAHFTEMMEYYYGELSSFVTQLGSDPNKVFSISKMWQHWRKYSVYGMNIVTSMLELLFVDNDDAPEFGELEKAPAFIKEKDRNMYLERMTDIVDHFLNFEINY